MPVVHSLCRCSPPLYLSRIWRYRPQISAYSEIAEKGHKNEKISPPHPRFTSNRALREVCVKEGRNLMEYVGSTDVQAYPHAHR